MSGTALFLRGVSFAVSFLVPLQAFAAGCNPNGTVQNTSPPVLPGRLVYQANDYPGSTAMGASGFFNHLYAFDFATPATAPVRLDASWGFCNAVNPNFSPDGGWIAFSARIGQTLDDCNSHVSQIYVYKLGTSSAPFNLFPTPSTNQEDPRFSADGTSIVFKTDRTNIAMAPITLNADGTATPGPVTAITFGSTEHSAPFLSPTGKSVYYFKGSGASSNIFQTSLATHVESVVTKPGYGAYYPIVRDLSALFYARRQNPSGSGGTQPDQLYVKFPYLVKTAEYQLGINACAQDNSDPASVDESLVIFSRTDTARNYHLFVGDVGTGKVWSLSVLTEPSGSAPVYNLLGGSYFGPGVLQ